MRFGVWVLLLYNFLSATYNLISGTNPHEEDYRLTVDWDSCGFFYSKTKTRRLYYVRETDNLIPRYGLYRNAFSGRWWRNISDLFYIKNQEVIWKTTSNIVRHKRAQLWKQTGSKNATVWAKCSPLYFDSEVVGSARLCVHWKTVGRQGTTHFAQHH